MAGINIVSQVMVEAENKLKDIPTINKDNVMYVYSDAEFVDKAEHLSTYPIVGVWYEGLVPQATKNNSGLAATLGLSLFVLGAPAQYTSIVEDKHDITLTLDEIRASFRNSSNPTGHKWQFVSEAPYPYDEDNNLIYIQRWQTNVILTS